MKKIIAVTSGKGGTGKSTVATGLGLVFAARDKRVLLIDLDAGLRCLDLMLGIDGQVVFDLGDVLNGTPLSDAVYPVPDHPNLSVLPAPIADGVYHPQVFARLTEAAAQAYDLVILDFPAGLDLALLESLAKTVQVLVVCNPDAVSVRDAASLRAHLPPTDAAPRLILNRFVAKQMQRGQVGNIDDIVDAAGFRLLGIVPEERELAALSRTHHLKPNQRSFFVFERLCGRLLGEQIELPKLTKI